MNGSVHEELGLDSINELSPRKRKKEKFTNRIVNIGFCSKGVELGLVYGLDNRPYISLRYKPKISDPLTIYQVVHVAHLGPLSVDAPIPPSPLSTN